VNQDSSFGIATDYMLDDRYSISGRGKIFLLSVASTLALGSTEPHMQWVPEALSPGGKAAGRETNHLPPLSAEVRKGGTIPPLTSLHGKALKYIIKYRDKFIFFLNMFESSMKVFSRF
jgi:hypothetical protein